MECNCYVKHLPYEVKFGLHFGAHALDCPDYRESGDPVDRANDLHIKIRENFRQKMGLLGKNQGEK